eukprot:CAMPEP_0170567986 /NCGR_PEP_ID=MMETSP0211-20121228/80841_1 /TAXON_ID=311385 /ORGANISM="Pseudokeronopsis sp., Strain OXSARD2" /LENGTH=67 /DNA_ID=CAMNT_0010889617 /DNA_START=98 /DNA_END=301 /DNA_ORIENTATION=-
MDVDARKHFLLQILEIPEQDEDMEEEEKEEYELALQDGHDNSEILKIELRFSNFLSSILIKLVLDLN